MHYRRVTRGAGAALAAAALTVGAAACSGHAGNHAAGHNPTHASVVPAAAQDPRAPLAVPNDVSARHHVAMTSCSGDARSWTAGGTATNTGHNAVRYQVTVFYTTAGATVVGSASTTVSVPAKGHANWSAPAKIKSGRDMRCVLRGVAVAS